MLYPKTNPVAKWIFKTYVKWLVGKCFNQFTYNAIQVDENKSVLLIANHFSFWDGLILFCLNDKLLKKKFHVMILHETAKKTGSLRYGGAFSIDKGSKDIMQSLDYAARLLNDPGNLVLMFPQGRLYPNFVDRIKFEKGIIKLIEKVTGNYQTIFASTFIQYSKHKKSNVSVYLKQVNDNYKGKSIDALQMDYQQHYSSSKQQQTETEL